jgi:HD-like signal output (HDOD) protein
MASSFPDQFAAIHRASREGTTDRLTLERQILGMDHCELGALYLEHHHLPDLMVQTARHHHQPRRAENYRNIVAAVQIADVLVRHAKIGDSGNSEEVGEEAWLEADGWSVLFPAGRGETERSIARAALSRAVERLPLILEGLV